MKITFFSILVVVILQATSIINLTQIYHNLLGRYTSHYSPDKVKQIIQQANIAHDKASDTKLEIRF